MALPPPNEPEIVKAARFGNADAVSTLLNSGVPVDATAPTAPKETALKAALDAAELEFAKLFGDPVRLVQGLPGPPGWQQKKPPSNFLSNFFKVVQLLLDANADVEPLTAFLKRIMDETMRSYARDEILEELLMANAVPALQKALEVQAGKPAGPAPTSRAVAILCEAFWNISKGSNARKDACSRAVPAIVLALKRHVGSPDVATCASLALRDMAEGSVWRQCYLHKVEALPALIAALEAHKAAPRVAECAGGALGALASVDPDIKTACVAALPALVGALRASCASRDACIALCAACRNVANYKLRPGPPPTFEDPSLVAVLAAAGVPGALEAAATAHPDLRSFFFPPPPAAAGGAQAKAAAAPNAAAGGGAGAGAAPAAAAPTAANPFPWLAMPNVNPVAGLGLHMLFPRRT